MPVVKVTYQRSSGFERNMELRIEDTEKVARDAALRAVPEDAVVEQLSVEEVSEI